MTVLSLLRIVAGLALALFVASIWAMPSEAHEGHGAPAAATPQAKVPAATPDVAAAAPDHGMAAGSADCTGQLDQSGSRKFACCSAACHAVIFTELASLRAATVAVAVLPALPAPPERSGPTVHIKRPPRPSAALVG